jgi:hypothetical protein
LTQLEKDNTKFRFKGVMDNVQPDLAATRAPAELIRLQTRKVLSNKYFKDSYSFSDSWRGRPALISNRARRAIPTIFYGREIKLLVESACGEKNMSYNLINSLIKAVQDEKFTEIKKRTAAILVSLVATV